jgi:hypothetical protein
MPEPLSDPPRREEPTPVPQPAPTDDADLLGAADPTDDSPTIISRRAPRPADADVFAGGLRGRHLAHFELIEPIGVGGMAAVLRARDTQLDRFVALKILPPAMAADAENVRRFHQEARSAAKLDHENIARVFFCGEDQRLHFIAFEFVEGENLRTILERRGRLPVAEALTCLVQVAAGLCHAAERGVVHRDIKPSNIIVTPNGRAKLVDMGLARSLDPQHDAGLTQSGVTLGTFDYISPEQALEPRDADVRSDIYSLGCTFYHMLTGRPPVPEGTAARKLHHHQHVKPTDPRQLAPDLPDEVALILDRMMAKKPGDRYQTAGELVHHLLAAARKVGASADVPEGVLFVEAALPHPPGTRPLLVASLLATILVCLVLIFDKPGPPGPAPEGPRAERPNGEDKGGNPGKAEVTDVKPPGHETLPDKRGDGDKVAAVARYNPADDGPLADWLQHHKGVPKLEIVLDEGLLPLERGLVIRARQVFIRAKDPNHRPTLALKYGADPQPSPAALAALTIESENATLEGLTFLVDGAGAPAPEVEMIGLLLRGGHADVRDCDFIQAQPSFDEKKRLSSLVVDARRASPSSLKLTQCSFLGFQERSEDGRTLSGVARGGQDALVRRGPVKQVTVSNCVFGPHAATFRFEGAAAEGGEFRVSHCSVLAADTSAVFHLHDQAEVVLDVRHSLFSRPGAARDPEAKVGTENAVLIRRAGAGTLTYQGHDNRYHQLDAFVAGPEVRTIARFEDFQNLLAARDSWPLGKDDSRPLDANPWKLEQPLEALEKQEVVDAFRVKPTLPELRLKKGDEGGRLIGAEELAGSSYVAKLPPLDDKTPDPVARKQRIVDPKIGENGNAVYRSLEAAIQDARPGDVILIKHNGDLAVEPIELKKESIDLTIRPQDGYHPILILNESELEDKDTSLFRLHDGEVRLEKLEFRLRPGKAPFKVQAVVALVGSGRCTFKDCLVTLDRAETDTTLALATVASPGGGKMDQPAKPRKPRIAIENCFVRGDGHCVWGRNGRPFVLDAKNSLVVLSRSFLNVDASGPDAAPTDQVVSANLTRVTTYLGGHLVRLNAGKDIKGLVPVQCKPDECLFLPRTQEAALIHLDGPETEVDKLLKEKLLWEAGRNAYGKFTFMFDQQPPERMSVKTIKTDRWKTFTKEEMSEFDVKLAAGPDAETPLTQLTPAPFKLMDLTGYGADLKQLRKLLREASDAK